MRWSVTRLSPIKKQYLFELVTIYTGHAPFPQDRMNFLYSSELIHQIGQSLCNLRQEWSLHCHVLRERVIKRQGCPKRLLTNNVAQYFVPVMREECNLWGLQHYTSAPYHLETKASPRRKSEKLRKSWRSSPMEGLKKWREYLGLATIAYLLMPHSSTGFPLFQML